MTKISVELHFFYLGKLHICPHTIIFMLKNKRQLSLQVKYDHFVPVRAIT